MANFCVLRGLQIVCAGREFCFRMGSLHSSMIIKLLPLVVRTMKLGLARTRIVNVVPSKCWASSTLNHYGQWSGRDGVGDPQLCWLFLPHSIRYKWIVGRICSLQVKFVHYFFFKSHLHLNFLSLQKKTTKIFLGIWIQCMDQQLGIPDVTQSVYSPSTILYVFADNIGACQFVSHSQPIIWIIELLKTLPHRTFKSRGITKHQFLSWDSALEFEPHP